MAFSQWEVETYAATFAVLIWISSSVISLFGPVFKFLIKIFISGPKIDLPVKNFWINPSIDF